VRATRVDRLLYINLAALSFPVKTRFVRANFSTPCLPRQLMSRPWCAGGRAIQVRQGRSLAAVLLDVSTPAAEPSGHSTDQIATRMVIALRPHHEFTMPPKRADEDRIALRRHKHCSSWQHAIDLCLLLETLVDPSIPACCVHRSDSRRDTNVHTVH